MVEALMPTIVVLDGYTLNPGDNPWAPLAALGNLIVHERTPVDQIAARAKDADILVTNKAILTAEMIAALPHLKMIAVTATDYNIVDTAAARQKKIPVTNVPVYSTDSVAQFVFALLLELCHRVGTYNRLIHEGEWNRREWSFWDGPLVELAGKTMGIVGFGRIGQRVATLAHAFGMNIIAFNRSPKPAPAIPGFAWTSLETLFSTADVISLHIPLTADSKNLVNKTLLARMKSDAYLINTARGPLINDADLAEALHEKRLAGAGLDVSSEEPINPQNPLLSAPNCIFTPHIAWATLAARRRLMQTTADNIAAFLAGNPIHVVN